MSAIRTHSPTTRILLASNLSILTDVLRRQLRRQIAPVTVGVAGTCAAARQWLRWAQPDVLLLDSALPDGDGLSLLAEIKRSCPNTRLLWLTSSQDQRALAGAFLAGVHGIVLKERSLEEAVALLRQAVGLARRPRETPAPHAPAPWLI